MKKLRLGTAIAVAVAVALVLAVLPAAVLAEEADFDEIVEAIDGERMLEDVLAISGAEYAGHEELSTDEVVDDPDMEGYDFEGLNNPATGADKGIRVGGSVEEAVTADWIQEQFEAMGAYEVEQVEFDLFSWGDVDDHEPNLIPYFEVNDLLLPVRAGSADGKIEWVEEQWNNEVVYEGEVTKVGTFSVNEDEEYEFQDCDFEDLEGEIALVELEEDWGNPSYSTSEYPFDFEELGGDGVTVDSGAFEPDFPGENPDVTDAVKYAEEAGARGLIVQNGSWRSWFSPVVDTENDDEDEELDWGIPFVGVPDEVGEKAVENGKAEIRLVAEHESQNVMAIREPEGGANDDTPIITFGAHYDTVPGAPGASDNTSGTASLLEIARAFANVDLDVKLRFVAYGAEEIGWQGAQYDVAEVLSEDQHERHIGMWNMDMTGTGFEHTDTLLIGTTPYYEDYPEDTVVGRKANMAADRLDLTVLDNIDRLHTRHWEASDHGAYGQTGIDTYGISGMDAANHIWRYIKPEDADGPSWHLGHLVPGMVVADFWDLEPVYHTNFDIYEYLCEDRQEFATQVIAGGAYIAATELLEDID